MRALLVFPGPEATHRDIVIAKSQIIELVEGAAGDISLSQLRELVASESTGQIDIGSARPWQYAVGDHSILDELPRNHAAEGFLGRGVVCGPCVIWGVGPGGESVGYDEV